MSSLDQRSAGTRRSRRRLAVLTVPALFVLASCGTGEDGLGQRYPVSGTVTYNGSPLEKGQISFISEDMSKNFGAIGTIANGSYTLSTSGEGDGAQAGTYKVTISVKEEYMAKAEADFRKETGGGSPKLLPSFVGKAAAAAKSLIPAGYGDARTTTLKAKVEARSNTLNFQLSDAEAPPEPPRSPGNPGASGRIRH